MGSTSFEDLDVWKRAARLSAKIYRALSTLKDYGFKDQITRSGLSIPSNIAEGMDRNSVKDKCRFLDIARGSCAELRTQVYIGMEIEYIDTEEGKDWIKETKAISAMLVGLSRSLQNSSQSTS